ncbi:MAG: hypothetical protein IKL09_07745, partial [Clostridia bacterium]|nr:hypothetical protein [Clostridia bacterium]
NLVFVGFMSMGVAGAAISTVIGQGVGLIIVGSHFLSKKNTLKFRFAFDSSVCRIIKNGFGSALSFVYQFVTIIVMNHYVVQISGPEGIVIYTVVFNLCTVSLAVFEGLSQTTQPMISLYFGEKSNKKIKDSVKLSVLSAVIICGSVMAILEAFPAIVPHMFGISESGLIQQSALAVRIYTTSMFIMTLNVIIGNYLQSIEFGQITSVLVSLRCCVLLLICVFVLGELFGLGGIWAAYTVAEILTFIVFMVINIIKREKLSKNNVSADIFFLDKRVEESCKSLVYKCNTNEYESFCNEIKTIADKIAIYNEKMLITALEYLTKLEDVIVDKKGKYIEVEFNASDEKIIISDNLSHDKLKDDFAKITDEGIEYGPVLGLNRICIKRRETMNKRKLASLEITNDKGFIFPVMSFIDSLVQRHTSVDASIYQQIRFVALEVLKQRIENSYPGSKGDIFVELYIVGDFFEISVRDKGIPGWQDFSFDKSTISENKKDLRNYMISIYVDEIGMEKLGNNGQRVFVR